MRNDTITSGGDFLNHNDLRESITSDNFAIGKAGVIHNNDLMSSNRQSIIESENSDNIIKNNKPVKAINNYNQSGMEDNEDEEDNILAFKDNNISNNSSNFKANFA